MARGRRLVSKIQVVNEFFDRLQAEKPELYECVEAGLSTLDIVRKIAMIVGFGREIKAGDKIVDILNAIWPLIMEYKNEKSDGS